MYLVRIIYHDQITNIIFMIFFFINLNVLQIRFKNAYELTQFFYCIFKFYIPGFRNIILTD